MIVRVVKRVSDDCWLKKNINAKLYEVAGTYNNNNYVEWMLVNSHKNFFWEPIKSVSYCGTAKHCWRDIVNNDLKTLNVPP